MKRFPISALLFGMLAVSTGFSHVIMRDAASPYNELKWPVSNDIHYCISDVSRPSTFDAMVAAAAASWQDEERSDVVFTCDGLGNPNPPMSNDGVNNVFYGPVWPYTYGNAYVWYSSPGGAITGFDIYVVPDPQVTPLYPWHFEPDGAPGSNEVDGLTLVRHWLGHCLGVGCLTVPDLAGNTEKVMYQPIRPGHSCKMTQDDKDAAAYQYPLPQYVNDRVWIRDGGYNYYDFDLDDGDEPYPYYYSWNSPDLQISNLPIEPNKVMHINVKSRNLTNDYQTCWIRLEAHQPWVTGFGTGTMGWSYKTETRLCTIPPGNLDHDNDGAIRNTNPDWTNPAGSGELTTTFDWVMPYDIMKCGKTCLIAIVYQTPEYGPDAEPPTLSLVADRNNLAQTNYFFNAVPESSATDGRTSSVAFRSPNLTRVPVVRYLTTQFADSTNWTVELDPPSQPGESMPADDTGDVFTATVHIAPDAQPGDTHCLLVTCVLVNPATGETLDIGGVTLNTAYYAAARAPGWERKSDVPAGPKSKKVKAGGSLAGWESGDTARVLALKGNKTTEMYSFDVFGDSWQAVADTPVCVGSGRNHGYRYSGLMAPLPPRDQTKQPTDEESTKVGGTVLIRENPGLTDILVHEDTGKGWTAHAIPSGFGPFKKGCGITGTIVRTPSDTFRYVFALEGNGTTRFDRYTVETNSWAAMAGAPLGVSGKGYKDGSCLTSDGQSKVYVLKANGNEFFAYDMATNVWTAKATLPLRGVSGKKKKAGGGAALAYLNGYVYCQKGNNTIEIWRYDPSTDAWTQTEDMPVGGGKKVKGGGAMTAVGGKLYGLKGNNTLEFYRYTPATAFGNGEARSPNGEQNSETGARTSSFALRTFPNPFSTAATISYSVTQAGNVSLKLYDINGKLVATLTSGYHRAGLSTFNFQLSTLRLSSGIYLLKIETGNSATTSKLIIE